MSFPTNQGEILSPLGPSQSGKSIYECVMQRLARIFILTVRNDLHSLCRSRESNCLGFYLRLGFRSTYELLAYSSLDVLELFFGTIFRRFSKEKTKQITNACMWICISQFTLKNTTFKNISKRSNCIIHET